MTAQDVISIVDRYLHTAETEPLGLKILHAGVRPEEDWWYVPVSPSRLPSSTSSYYEMLADIEVKLLDSENLNVLFVPTAPDEDAA